MWDRDPKFAQALYDAQKAGVRVWCITTNISETQMTYQIEIPVNLVPPE
jgi:DNA-binding sugar fermentation-stimulating protein